MQNARTYHVPAENVNCDVPTLENTTIPINVLQLYGFQITFDQSIPWFANHQPFFAMTIHGQNHLLPPGRDQVQNNPNQRTANSIREYFQWLSTGSLSD